ncbi:MAG TPA: YopT-type cysteine protease domain-containing protein, partial [Burkholderiaceae bacterium]|nr:YopT-type cysteine protease domain-containing protein [Burkholderiaceae bacterium]
GIYTNDKAMKSDTSLLYVGGMCHSMSLYWIAHQVQGGGKSFWDWLKPAGNFDDAAINVLVAKTVMYKSGGKQREQGIVKDPNFDDRFFLKYGLKPVEEKSGLTAVATAMVAARTRFYLIGYHGGGGHACAIHAMGFYGGAIYYDPNYGDFTFPDYMDAISWFMDYVRITKYDQKYPEVSLSGYEKA